MQMTRVLVSLITQRSRVQIPPPLQVEPQVRGPFLRKRASAHFIIASTFVAKRLPEPHSRWPRWGRHGETRRDVEPQWGRRVNPKWLPPETPSPEIWIPPVSARALGSAALSGEGAAIVDGSINRPVQIRRSALSCGLQIRAGWLAGSGASVRTRLSGATQTPATRDLRR